MIRLLFWLLLAAAVAAPAAPLETLTDARGKPVRYAGRVAGGTVKIPVHYAPRAAELRGVWVATVENIDFGVHRDAESFRRDYRKLLDRLRAMRFNAVFFQVRANNDAFYPSRYNPWSRWLTGEEGRAITGFDPLRFLVEETKKRGMEFHAWLNPYRVIGRTPLSKKAYLATLDPRNFARRNPELVLDAPLSGGQRLLFLNPGEPAVIAHVVRTVAEIVDRYAVDAIHFDDYFYPYSEIGGIDAAAFRRNNPRKLALDDWRRANVTALIDEVHATVRKRGRRFGISPFGIWANRKNHPAGSLTAGKQSYFTQYADTRDWVRSRRIDYIVPQLYWPFGHEVAAYAALADWWAEQVRGTGVQLYIGHGAYQMGRGALWKDPNELFNQLRYNAGRPEIKGSVLFSCRSVLAPDNAVLRQGIARVLRECWNRPAVVPGGRTAAAMYPEFR